MSQTARSTAIRARLRTVTRNADNYCSFGPCWIRGQLIGSPRHCARAAPVKRPSKARRSPADLSPVGRVDEPGSAKLHSAVPGTNLGLPEEQILVRRLRLAVSFWINT